MATQVKVSDLVGDIERYIYDPSQIQRPMMRAIEQMLNGEVDIVDATNPFVNLLEMSAVTTAAARQHNAVMTRKQYPTSAMDFEDLYLHMSDRDYVGMFALPSTANFYVLLQYDELINSLIQDPVTGIRQLTIPRNTEFLVSDTSYSIQYPIKIRMMDHGELQVVYDASIPSPLQDLETNVLVSDYVKIADGRSYLRFQVPTQQFSIKSVTATVTASSGQVTLVSFADQYYFARVYQQIAGGSWVELATTYTDQVFDSTKPTVVLNVSDSVLKVVVPPVYAFNGTISGKMRIDVYQTKGPMAVPLGAVSPDQFRADWIAIDKTEQTADVAVLNKFKSVQVFSNDITTGGRNALTFEQMRQRVINNTIGPRQIPITPAQIQNAIVDEGFSVVKHVDTITNRAFWATRSLPSPQEAVSSLVDVFTPANASVNGVICSIEEASSLQGCVPHSRGMTITSDAFFRSENGQTTLMSKLAYSSLASLSQSNLADAINAGNFTFSPFYYVLDNTEDIFDVRPYYMDDPKIVKRTFVRENATSGYQASIGSNFSLKKLNNGYRLYLTTKSSKSFKDLSDSTVFCQLLFTSLTGEDAHLNATYLSTDSNGERTFTVDFLTNYNVGKADDMELLNFVTASGDSAFTALSQKFTVLFGVSASIPTTFVGSAIDALLVKSDLPEGAVGITQEELVLKFGNRLETLWCNFRTIAAEIPYQTYPNDVPKYHLSDVFLKDPVTNSDFSIVAGELVFTKLHSVGDPVLDSLGNPVFLHRAGDPVIDPVTGLPKPIDGYSTKLKRSIDIFMISGVYRFASDQLTKDYLSFVYKSLLTWMSEQLVSLNRRVLEQTKISFYPNVTQGTIDVTADNGVIVSMNADQKLEIKLYVPKETSANSELLASLSRATIKTIGAYLSSKTTVSVSDLATTLRGMYGGDVLDVEIYGFGGTQNYKVMSLPANSSARLSLGKALVLQASSQLAVKENVKITFIQHTT